MPEPHIFFPELPSTLLAPTVSTLRYLRLYSDMYFGFFPKLDLDGIDFPLLRMLSFSKYTFFHDRILTHASTLEGIYLDDYPLLCEIAVSEENKARCCLEEREWFQRDNDPESGWGYRYNRRWGAYFDCMREKLPSMKHFRMGVDCQFPQTPSI